MSYSNYCLRLHICVIISHLILFIFGVDFQCSELEGDLLSSSALYPEKASVMSVVFTS